MAKPIPEYSKQLIVVTTKLPRDINQELDDHHEAKSQILAKGAAMYMASTPGILVIEEG